MTSDQLFTAAMNDKLAWSAVNGAVKILLLAMNTLAKKVAQENAEWHDDPTCEDHAEYHASADEQFPLHVRHETIRDLVAHYLTERELSGT